MPVPGSSGATSSASLDLPEREERAPDVEHLSSPPGRGAEQPVEWSPRPLVWVALVAILIGRILAPALPGSHSGISRWIAATEQVAALVTQIWVLLGTLLGMRLVVFTLRSRTLPVWYRALATACGGAVLVLAMGAAELALAPDVVLVLGVSSALTAVGASLLAARPPAFRAAGLVLGLEGVAGLVQLGSRLIALNASDQALTFWYQAARGVATFGFLLDVLALGVALLWLSRARPLRAASLIAPLCVIALLLSWAAIAGSHYGAPVWQVIAARGLGEITRAPLPFVVPFLRYSVELAALLVAGAVAWLANGSRVAQTSLALALLSRASTDIPALALVLLVAALLGALGAAQEADSTPARA